MTQTATAAIACGPRTVITVKNARCRACGRTGEHATQWMGVYFGEDQVCLSCGAAVLEGEPTILSASQTAWWEEMFERDLIPVEFYDRYVAADRALHSAHTGLAEVLANLRLRTVAEDIGTYYAAQTGPTEKSHQ